MQMAMENLQIAQHRNTLRYAYKRVDSYKPKVRQFEIDDFVYLQRQPNDTSDTSTSRTLLLCKGIDDVDLMLLCNNCNAICFNLHRSSHKLC
ncbi:hypothetical protein MPTK1_5g14680 [Marchantia polymorpha subsp. ruderalis]|uniref:Uncharacterized protein n=2 Tax=Marchantia polymorpha TaxID=3197 RepID=A0AAF6BIE6_MARPO|nr:hypothetical protein MARPO_0032s0160 [Marchantia polymorpha]BBN11780.1 hypothetical protein Mp_5g14680 [Marchantia polymorpha subsp. ruderalis]|eukprot:PTQ41998.1 hypothetical protein MARPO_0032s0160 [Marchantia polymorpha]